MKALLLNGVIAYLLFQPMDLYSDNLMYSVFIPMMFGLSIMGMLFFVLKVLQSLPESR